MNRETCHVKVLREIDIMLAVGKTNRQLESDCIIFSHLPCRKCLLRFLDLGHQRAWRFRRFVVPTLLFPFLLFHSF